MLTPLVEKQIVGLDGRKGSRPRTPWSDDLNALTRQPTQRNLRTAETNSAYRRLSFSVSDAAAQITRHYTLRSMAVGRQQ